MAPVIPKSQSRTTVLRNNWRTFKLKLQFSVGQCLATAFINHVLLSNIMLAISSGLTHWLGFPSLVTLDWPQRLLPPTSTHWSGFPSSAPWTLTSALRLLPPTSYTTTCITLITGSRLRLFLDTFLLFLPSGFDFLKNFGIVSMSCTVLQMIQANK
jgi:hypothetical protein